MRDLEAGALGGRTVQGVLGWSKMVQDGPRWSKMVQDGPRVQDAQSVRWSGSAFVF